MVLLGGGLACLALLAGCGDGESTDSTAAPTDAATEAATESTESTESAEPATTTPGEPPYEALTDTGEVPVDGAPDPNLSVGEVAEKLPLPEPISDDTAFTDALGIFVAASYKYFGESIELLGKPYHLPDELIAYDGATGDEGPDCFGEPTGA